MTRKTPSADHPAGAPPDRDELLRRLAAAIPEPRCELRFRDPWTLLIATILSAQSTDRTVNTVTPLLFEKWPTPLALATAPRAEVEEVVHRTGFFRNKTKAIQGASRELHERHGGQVPNDMDALLALPGVARKTANLVLGVAFGVASGVVVDTHVMRVSRRLGLSSHATAEKVEQDLCRQFERHHWIELGHRLLLLGRYVCFAKGPDCEQCPLADICSSRAANGDGTWQQRAEHVRQVIASAPK